MVERATPWQVLLTSKILGRGQGDGAPRGGGRDVLWRSVEPGSHLIRSWSHSFQIRNRKSRPGARVVGIFPWKVPPFRKREAVSLLPPPSFQGEPSLSPGVPRRAVLAGGGTGRASGSGAGEAPPARVAAGDTPVPSAGRGLSWAFLSSSSISHRLRPHQPSLSPASAHHPAAAARR